jgi:hypothetical protein
MSNIEIIEWEKAGMPKFFQPTRDTDKRNSYDISDFQEFCKNTKTTMFPKYPIYIISKGRWEKPLTARSLDKLGVDYKIVVESSEYELYKGNIDDEKILVLPFVTNGMGSIQARNWVLEHSSYNGNKRHWVLDDNIDGFGYQKYGRRVNSICGDFFRQCEDFTDRYKNVKISGIRYRFHHNYTKTPFILNTRIYSCILIDNSIRHSWRGKYNEDTDLSIRTLKDGDVTLLFTWCYCNKAATMTTKGGNEDIYNKSNNRLDFAKSLEEQHPDIVKVVWRYNRWHHDVNYKNFIQELKK